MKKENTSCRDFLRQATQDEHSRAEKVWTTAGNLRNLANYRAFLNVLLKTHTTLGLPASKILMSAELIEEEQGRSNELLSDLKLNSAPQSGEQMALTPDEAWGVLYVLNGSALGAFSLLNRSDWEQEWPCAYLKRMRDYAKSGLLKTFFTDMNIQVIDPHVASKAARQTFRSISEDITLREI